MTREKYTLTFEFIDHNGTIEKKTVSIESHVVKDDEIIEWLPGALLAVGHFSAAAELKRIIDEVA